MSSELKLNELTFLSLPGHALFKLLTFQLPFQTFFFLLLSHLPFQCFLTFVEVLNDDSDEHVQYEETDEEEKGDEVDHPPFIEVFDWLHINPNSINALVHDRNPSVFAGEHKQRHESLSQIIKVVAVVDPFVSAVFQAICFGGYIADFWSNTVIHHSFEQLNAKDSKDNEEGATNQNDVTDGF